METQERREGGRGGRRGGGKEGGREGEEEKNLTSVLSLKHLRNLGVPISIIAPVDGAA